MQKFRLTINRIWEKEVQTKFGDKIKYSIEFKEKPRIYIDSFVGNWNKEWKTGDVVEFSEEQLRERQYNGRKYFTLMAPPEAKLNGVTRNEFDILVSRVSEIEQKLEEKEKTTEDKEIENIVAEIPF